MNTMEQYLLANHLIHLCDQEEDILVGKYKNEKKEEEVIYKKDQYEYILNSNLNPLLFIKEKLLIIYIVESNMKVTLIDRFFEKISKEELSNLDEDNINRILLKIQDEGYDNGFNLLFKKGLKVNQGNDDAAVEYQMAIKGSLAFFEQLLEFQPDFDLQKKYKDNEENLTLLQVIELEKGSTTNYREKEEYEKTLVLLQNFMKIQNYNNLSTSLENNKEAEIRVKI